MMLTDTDIIGLNAVNFGRRNNKRFMRLDKLIPRQVIFDGFEGKIGDVFLFAGLKYNIILQRFGKKKWRKQVKKVIALLSAALEPDDIVIGGGNVEKLGKLPAGCRHGDNENAFIGGFRLWDAPHNRNTLVRRKKTSSRRQGKPSQ